MGFNDEYMKLRKKRLDDAEKEADKKATNKTFTDTYNELRNERIGESDDTPVSPGKTRMSYSSGAVFGEDEKGNIKNWRDEKRKLDQAEEERTWFTKPEALEDGYQFGDLAKTWAASTSNSGDAVLEGIIGMGEDIVDAAAYIVGGVGGLLGADEFKKDTEKFIEKELYDAGAVADKVGYMNWLNKGANAILNDGDKESNSVWGEKSEGLAQSGGQLAAKIGLQAVGVPWWLTTGVTSFGSRADAAFKEGASYGEAGLSGAISAGVEILTGKLFGGSGLGEKGLINLAPLTKGITNKIVKAIADYSVDMLAEGVEEVAAEAVNNLASALYREEDPLELLLNEEAFEGYIDAAIGGALLGGVANVSKVENSIKTGRDYRTGLTENEQKVFDSEYKKRVGEAGGETISKKAKAKIYDDVMRDLKKGFISTDKIEEILGADTYKAYKDAVANEDAIAKEYAELGSKEYLDPAEYERYVELGKQIENKQSEQLKTDADKRFSKLLKKDTYLQNSYAERARRGQAFDADLTKYKDENARKTVENAIKYGMNNGTEAHEFVDFAAKIAAKKGFVVDFTNTKMLRESGKDQYGIEPDAADIEGFVSESKKTIVINMDANRSFRSVVGHEVTHTLETSDAYGKLQKYIFDYARAKNEYESRYKDIESRYSGVKADIQKELTADLCGDYLLTDYDFIQQLATKDRNVFQKVYDEIKYMFKLATAGSKEARALEKAKHYYEKALREATKAEGKGEKDARSVYEQVKTVDSKTATSDPDIRDSLRELDGGSVTKYSLSTWTPETQMKVRGNLVKAGYEADRVDKWIKDTNSVASVIAADKDRLDFEAADNQVMLKDNQEYIKTLDASTLCAKRLVYQGTFDAIQHRMPNTMLTSDDLIDLLNMMKEHGEQTPCGVCYVESRRRHLGKFAQEWLNDYEGEYKPNLDEVTTSDGLEALRKSHPQTYQDFVDAMNKKGSANPKVVQLRTEYRNEIMSLTPAEIRKIESAGGLRVQSFSDFETPHMLDMMQAVMDMTAKGLHSQAYTKVPNFAWVFGATGIKINLSLIAEGDGFDSDGNLAFSSAEGMDIAEAMKLRDAYSANVGTIVVGANDKHILACMADDRIDFIIPFHRSGWGMKELDMMGMSAYTDYTYGQKEHDLATGKGVESLHPSDYWDYSLSGKENAERYLNLCAKIGREPKFSKFLVDNGDGSYSLQPDGSTDGYWKTLVDFKMYDNDGNGAAQQKVQPNFNMVEAYRVLSEYEGGANRLPVAKDVVEEFVAKYQSAEERSPSMALARGTEKTYGNYNVYGRDLELAPTAEDIAPMPKDAKKDWHDIVSAAREPEVDEHGDWTQEYADYHKGVMEQLTFDAMGEVVSDVDNGLTSEELKAKSDAAMQEYERFMSTKKQGEALTEKEMLTLQALYSRYSYYDSVAQDATYADKLRYSLSKGAETDTDAKARLDSLTESDMPPEFDAPYADDRQRAFPDDPFAKRDIDAVGDRKVKAYQYENPEVKPYFTEAAIGMYDDLRNSTKGERWYNGELYYDTNGEQGFGGTKRHTTDDIAYLLDSWGYTYDQIEEGLNAIIEDDGRENNAVSKRIEFLLHERLASGYTTIEGYKIPPNEGYLRLLEEKEIAEYNKGAFDALMQHADEYAPPVREKRVQVTETAEQKKAESKKTETGKTDHDRIAEILTEEPTTKSKRNKRKWAIFKANVLDKGAVFEDVSLKHGNRELMGKWNYTLYSEARAQRLMGKGAKGVKSLNAIREEVAQSGMTKQFYDYMYHRHNIDRMTLADRYEDVQNKSVLGDAVTAKISQDIVDRYEQRNPQFKKYAEDVYAYNRHLRQMLVEGGVISQETADLWEEMYPHYVPIRRSGDEGVNVNVPLDTGRTGVNAPVKKATGGNRDILPLFDTMAQRTVQTFKAVAKNSFGVELKNTLGTTAEQSETDLDEMIDSVEVQDGLLQEGKDGRSPTFTVFENGEKVTFEITEDIYDALKPVSDSSFLSKTVKPLNWMSRSHRGLLTEYNPVFMLTNAIKDAQDVLINSQHVAKTYTKIPEAFAQIVRKGYWYQEYMDNGGDQNSYFDNDTNTFKTESKGLQRILDLPPFSTISKLNNFIEMIPRLAEYIASREAGASVEVAMLDAARVTTNFKAGGDFTKFLNRNGVTFLNASVQGAMQQVRNVREAKANGLKGYIGLAAKYTAAAIPVIVLNSLVWDDDEDYEELSDYVKDNYYIVGKFGDGQFVRIPKGRMVAVIQDAVEQVSNALTGDDEADFAHTIELAFSNIAPNNPIDNNILAPIFQVKNNKTWYGDDLVPTRLQDLPAAEQYDESTDAVSRWLGEKLNRSPYKINYLLDQYSGGLGDMLLPMLTPEAESGDNSLLGNLIAPLKDKFTTDSVMNNQNVSDFYELKTELTANAKSMGATDEDVLKAKYINSVNSELSELYKQKREIQNSDLPDDEKYEAVRDIQKRIVSLAKNGLNSYDTVRIDGVYATVGDKHYRLDDGTWTKISDTQYKRQQEVTRELGISPSEYWSKTDISFMPKSDGEYEYAYDYPGNYAVSKAVGGYDAYKTYSSELYDIHADKDEEGNSILGSRKEKVIDYVNNLDVEYGVKCILFKSEYPADDTYNADILEYLNSREDLTYDDIKTILTELGCTVYDDGTVEW